MINKWVSIHKNERLERVTIESTCLDMTSPPMTKHIASRSPVDSRRLLATIAIVKRKSADAVRKASKQYKRNTRKQQTLKMLTKPPSSLLDNYQADNTSREHPAKDADTNTNKKPIIHDPNVTKRLGRVTSGLSVGNVLPADNSNISSINDCKNKSSVNISNIDDRSKAAIALIITTAADKTKLWNNQAGSLSV